MICSVGECEAPCTYKITYKSDDYLHAWRVMGACEQHADEVYRTATVNSVDRTVSIEGIHGQAYSDDRR